MAAGYENDVNDVADTPCISAGPQVQLSTWRMRHYAANDLVVNGTISGWVTKS